MVVTIDGIPVYDALVTDAETGMFKISLVDDPAVMSNFLSFDKERKPLMYTIENEEKRLVRGVVMRADFPIYRYDKYLGEYYVIYKADQIRIMAEKYLAESRCNNVNTMHEANSDVEGVQMVQYFIKGDGVYVAGFDDIADGSLFAEFHVINDEVWEEIKAGTYKGFSLEGVFDLVPETDIDEMQDILDVLNGAFKKLFKHTNMSKLNKIKEALAKMLQEFGSITTDRGVLAWDGEEDIKVGDEVYVVSADGENTPAEDGEYICEDGRVIVVAENKVAEIKEAEAPEAEPAVEEPVEIESGEDVPVAEEPVEEAPEAEPVVDDKDERIKELEERIKELEAENAALKEANAEMQKMSAAKPAHEVVETSVKFAKTGNKGIDNLARILSAK